MVFWFREINIVYVGQGRNPLDIIIIITIIIIIIIY